MAIPINIEELLRQRVIESSRIEYKKDWNPEPILHSVTAFANDFDNLGGGYILIGVEEQNGYPRFPLKGLNEDVLILFRRNSLINVTLLNRATYRS